MLDEGNEPEFTSSTRDVVLPFAIIGPTFVPGVQFFVSWVSMSRFDQVQHDIRIAFTLYDVAV